MTMNTELNTKAVDAIVRAAGATMSVAKAAAAIANGVTDPAQLCESLTAIRREAFARTEKHQPAVERPDRKKAVVNQIAYFVKVTGGLFDGKFKWNQKAASYEFEDNSHTPKTADGKQSAADASVQSAQMVENAMTAAEALEAAAQAAKAIDPKVKKALDNLIKAVGFSDVVEAVQLLAAERAAMEAAEAEEKDAA